MLIRLQLRLSPFKLGLFLLVLAGVGILLTAAAHAEEKVSPASASVPDLLGTPISPAHLDRLQAASSAYTQASSDYDAADLAALRAERARAEVEKRVADAITKANAELATIRAEIHCPDCVPSPDGKTWVRAPRPAPSANATAPVDPKKTSAPSSTSPATTASPK